MTISGDTRKSAALIVSYILFPQRTEVTFKWNIRYQFNMPVVKQVQKLAQGFYDYLDEWFEAVGQHKELDDGVAND